MKLFKVKLVSKDSVGSIPRAIATIERQGEYIHAVICYADDDRDEHGLNAKADELEDAWWMARRLHEELEGNAGTNSDVRGYFHLLEYFMD